MIDQLRRNAVALISLAIAISALGYNTWRNEQTELNRNYRFAAFQLITTLGQLQEIVFYRHYDRDEIRGNPRTGWTFVLTIQDLSEVLGEPVQTSARKLYDTWNAHWQSLGSDQQGTDEINAAIDQLRVVAKQRLKSLD